MMRKMGATGLKLSHDFGAGSVEIVFDRAGRRYAVRNNAYKNPKDNLRAAQLTITLHYQAIRTYGTQRGDTAIGGKPPTCRLVLPRL